MIEAIELSKSFGSVEAVKNVSFEVRAGEAVGFLGPNGAGKSTTFRMIAGTLGPTSGEVRLFGSELSKDPIETKRKLGYMPENAPLYPELTCAEFLDYRAELKGLPRATRRKAADLAIERAQIGDMRKIRITHLSKGYRQRVALAEAILGAPPVLLLDEPTAGLDPNQVLQVRALIRELAKDHAILVSTHVLSEVEATCSRAIVLHRGAIAGAGSLDSLRSQERGSRVVLVAKGDPQEIQGLLRTQFEVSHAGPGSATESTELELLLSKDQELDDALRLLHSGDFKVLEAGPKRAPLDDVFQALTQGEKKPPAKSEDHA